MQISYLRGACGVTTWEGERKKSFYKRCGMGACVPKWSEVVALPSLVVYLLKRHWILERGNKRETLVPI